MAVIYDQDTILVAMEQIFYEAAQHISQMDEDAFLVSRAPKWSAADIFDHMIRSAKPVAQGLSMPKIVLRNFGKPNRPSRTYDELVARYQEKLAAGGRSSGPYSPKAGTVYDREAMLKEWQSIGKKIIKRTTKNWKDSTLDQYLGPHPLLGKLTWREVLFFTIYHTGHHLKQL